jgi:hypothetical protein
MSDISGSAIRATLNGVANKQLKEVTCTIPDDKQFVATWRRQLQDCIAQHEMRLVKFLLNDTATSTDTDITRKCTDALQRVSKSKGLAPVDISLSTINADIECELGISPSQLREYIRHAVRMYVNVAETLGSATCALDKKIEKLEGVMDCIGHIHGLEPTAELGLLSAPLRTYLDSILGKIDIESNYKQILESHAKFTTLKSIVSLASFQQSATPTCGICMNKDITHALTPCGHTFCEDCCAKQVTACFICRAPVRDTLQLYFN